MMMMMMQQHPACYSKHENHVMRSGCRAPEVPHATPQKSERPKGGLLWLISTIQRVLCHARVWGREQVFVCLIYEADLT